MHPMTIKKEELKKLAKEIRELKQWRKGKNPPESHKNDGPLWNKRRNYRYEHIAYCLVRGRTYEQIENPGEHTKAVDKAWDAWNKINKLKDILQEQVNKAQEEYLCKKAANE